MYSLLDARPPEATRKGRLPGGSRESHAVAGGDVDPARASLLSYLDSDRSQDLPSPRPTPWREISTEMVLHWLWRGKWLIALCILLGAASGLGYGAFGARKFTVSSQIFIDPTNLRVMADDVFAQNNQLDMQIYDVESKLRILTSANVLNSVVDALSLAGDSEFVGGNSGDAQSDRLEAFRALEQHVEARREESSFIVNLDVWSYSAPKALEISDKIIASFQDELVKAQADGAGRAATELFARLDTLKGEVAEADEAVQRFRREHNILSSSGELVSTIVANQTNTQLVDAQARVIKARSRYEELSTGSLENRLDSASIDSQTMSSLRSQYAVVKRELDAQSAVFGARHPRIVAMRPQLDAIQNQITAEQTRILNAARSELAQAETALMAQQTQANAMKSVVFEDNESLVQLRQLEREAESRTSVYQAFMARAKEIAERQQINTTNVRIISPPTIPKSRSYPPRTLYLAVAGVAGGLLLGCMLAFALSFVRLLSKREEYGHHPLR
jgi:uncharacterized protein involved in exopolysaccharide biosynthesis